MKIMQQAMILIAAVAAIAACQPAVAPQPTATWIPSPPGMGLSSSAFNDSQDIPALYSCDGQNRLPALEWVSPPQGTASFAVTVVDPDAGDFTHWVQFDIPATAAKLAEGETQIGVAGQNDFGGTGYGGPCPPRGTPAHHYVFTLYALDTNTLTLSAGASRGEVESVMKSHILGQVQLIGLFKH